MWKRGKILPLFWDVSTSRNTKYWLQVRESLFKDWSGRCPGSGRLSSCEAMSDNTHWDLLGLACPSWAGRQGAFFSDSEPPSSWLETLLTCLYPCVLLPTLSFRLNRSSPFQCLSFFLHCGCAQPEERYLFRGFVFYTNECLLVPYKRIFIPLTSLPSPSLYLPRPCSFFWDLITSLFQIMPLPCAVMWVFPYLCHSYLIWYVPGCMVSTRCFSVVTLWCTSTGPSLPKPYLINKLPVYSKRNKHWDPKTFLTKRSGELATGTSK